EIIVELISSRVEFAKICKIRQAALLFEIVKEGKLARRILSRNEILEERGLHRRAFHLHSRMPRERGLALEEDAGRTKPRIVERNAQRQVRRAESHADNFVFDRIIHNERL